MIDTAKLTATILSGAVLSNAVELEQEVYLCNMITPTMTTSTAIIFQVAHKASDTFVPLYDGSGARYSRTIDPAINGYAVPLDASVFMGWRYVKLEVANAQAADRTITLGARRY